MRKTFFLLFSVIWTLTFLPVVAMAEGERIDAFTIHIKLEPNGSALVQEEIIYNFGENAVDRHGIFRKVPLVYTLPGEKIPRQIEISSIMVTDGNGRLLQTVYTGGGNIMQLKIGDPNVLVTGRVRYVIRYTVWGGINQDLHDIDEFYWNATGNDWDVPIDSVRTDIDLPLPIQESKLVTACYVGPTGSTQTCTASTSPQEGTGVINSIRYTHQGGLPAREGMTVAIGIPKDIFAIAPTSRVKKLAEGVGVYHWWRKNISEYAGWSLILPLIVFAAMFRLWWQRGRDPEGSGVIVAEYDIPEKLSPLEVFYLKHGHLQPHAISAAIIDLAIRGYLTIRRTEKKVLLFTTEDFQLAFTEKDPSGLGVHETILYGALRAHGQSFMLSALAHKLTAVNTDLSTALAKDLTEKNFYETNPQVATRAYLITGIVLFVVSFVLPFLNLSLALSGIIIFIFGSLMARVTKRGAFTKEHIEGFKLFLDVTGEDRIPFANSIENDPSLFEKLLPYAMIFGVEKAWAGKFAHLFTQKDSSGWYHSSGATLYATSLASSMASFSSSTASAFSASGGGSSGGGSSGGGGGGGGGGGW